MGAPHKEVLVPVYKPDISDPTKSNICLLHQNIRGVISSTEELEILVDLQSPDIIGFSEQFLCESDFDVPIVKGFTNVSHFFRAYIKRVGVCLIT